LTENKSHKITIIGLYSQYKDIIKPSIKISGIIIILNLLFIGITLIISQTYSIKEYLKNLIDTTFIEGSISIAFGSIILFTGGRRLSIESMRILYQIIMIGALLIASSIILTLIYFII
jgi:hypothetical protein